MNDEVDTTSRPWWKDAVIYQIYPRSFADSNGDGVGDLRRILDRLPYLRTLGVDAIWISPFYRSPMVDYGHDVADHTAVDPVFGTDADADALITAAHVHGLRVLVDIVLSHTMGVRAEPPHALLSSDETCGAVSSSNSSTVRLIALAPKGALARTKL